MKICFKLSRRMAFISMMALTSSFFIVEIVVGYLTNSMSLVADSFHMLSDIASLVVGYIAVRYSERDKRTNRYTFGWVRAEVLGALVNAVFLVALCFSILVESFKRMVVPETIQDPKLVLFVGAVGLIVNIIGLFIFHEHGHSHSGHSHSGHSHSGHSHSQKSREKRKDVIENPCIEGNRLSEKENAAVCLDVLHEDTQNKESHLNMRGVYLHILGDALGSVIVISSALVIMFIKGNWTCYVDPSMSIVMVIIILKTSISLLKESSTILMQTAPTHIRLDEIQDRIVKRVPQILNIHEFHVWQLAGNKIIASAHIQCNTLDDYMAVANQLKEFFHNEGIHSTTIQPEFLKGISTINSDSCALECNEECEALTCCGKSNHADELKQKTLTATLKSPLVFHIHKC